MSGPAAHRVGGRTRPYPPGAPTFTAAAPVPARRTPRSLPAHPYPPGAPEVTGASGAKGCGTKPTPSPARLTVGPTLAVHGAPVPAMRTPNALRQHPYPPGAPEVTGASGAKGCAPSPTRTPQGRSYPDCARRTRTRPAHPTFTAGAPVPARRTRGYGGERRKGVRTAPHTTTQVPEMRGCQS